LVAIIEGDSMQPTFHEGDAVLVEEGAYVDLLPSPGEVVLARHPFRDILMVKRVSHITPEGRAFLVGDNPAQSTDSRAWGVLRRDLLVGRVRGLWR